MRIVIVFVILFFNFFAATASEKQKVLFDCDLGGDIDDAFALALLLSSPEFEVLGLIMDHGNTVKRAQVAARFLYECGLEQIPIVVGKPTPLIVGQDSTIAGDAPQFAWAKGFNKLKPIKQNAADFIIEKLKANPGQIILFTVGPVPNINEVLKKDPQVLRLAKRVVSMFGSFYMGYKLGSPPEPEWNVKADVEAARSLIQAGIEPLLAGLDVTAFVKLKKPERLRLLYRNSPLTNALCALYSLWLYEPYAEETPTLYDPVAVGLVLWPDLFETKRVHIEIDEYGNTIIDEGKSPNCEIAIHIQQDEFIRRMMKRLLLQNFMPAFNSQLKMER